MGPFIATSLYYYLLELDGQSILIYSKNELKTSNHISFLFPGWLALQPMVPWIEPFLSPQQQILDDCNAFCSLEM